MSGSSYDERPFLRVYEGLQAVSGAKRSFKFEKTEQRRAINAKVDQLFSGKYPGCWGFGLSLSLVVVEWRIFALD